MWDPEQLSEIAVIADRLQARGDPLGEWLALRMRLDGAGLPRAERRALGRRVRSLRDALGPRVVLAENPELGRPFARRELGLIADLSLDEASPDRLARICARPDAPFLLRVKLGGELDALRGCVALLVQPSSRGLGGTRTSLRQLELEARDRAGDPDPDAELELLRQLVAEGELLTAALPSLFSLLVGPEAVALPFDPDLLAEPSAATPWTPPRRATLGRALVSPDPASRRRALVALRGHGELAAQLQGPLVRTILNEPDPEVRAAAFAVVPRLGPRISSILALLADVARDRDDPQLHEWLAVSRRF